MKKDNADLNDRLVNSLKDDFLQDCDARLSRMEAALSAFDEKRIDVQSLILQLVREAHNIKGTGSAFGFTALSMISHRLEDFIRGYGEDIVHKMPELYDYVDKLGNIVESGSNIDDGELATLLKSLPSYSKLEKTEPNDLPPLDVVLITSSITLGRIIGRQLDGLGLNVSTFYDPFQALSYIVRMQPDLVVTSAVLNGMTGVDLLSCLQVMHHTGHILGIIVTSTKKDAKDNSHSQQQFKIAFLEKTLKEDLLNFIHRFCITKPALGKEAAVPAA
ncbi:MAG: Hpt domain-containing protein [Alphaproteobacteria bacterium]